MTINKEVINKCRELFISLDELAYLYCRGMSVDWGIELTTTSSHKLYALGLLTEDFISDKCLDMLSTLFPAYIKSEEYTPEFEKFWKRYPRDTGTGRDLKGHKRAAFTAYQSAINRGFSPNIMQRGLEMELAMKSSSAEGLKFMKHILNYLNTDHFNKFTDEDIQFNRYGKDLL